MSMEQPLDFEDESTVKGFEHVKELVETGALSPEIASNFPLDRCLCAHRRGAHEGACRARRCPCPEFRQDPRYVLPAPKVNP